MKILITLLALVCAAHGQFSAHKMFFSKNVVAGVPISYISSASANATTVSMPTHAIGDCIIVTAFNSSGTNAIAIPSGYTLLEKTTGTRELVVAYKVAISAAETTGTWTNANTISVGVYRGVAGIGAVGKNEGTNNTITFGTLDSMQKTDGTSWVVAMGACNRAETITITDITARETRSGTNPSSIFGDTNGGVASSGAETFVMGGSVAWASAKVELVDELSANSISHVSSASALADTVAMPAHLTGDLIIVSAYREANATIPTAPAGYTTIQSASNGNGFIVSYKVAASAAETTGTWTNAQTIVISVYRGVTSIGTSATNTNNNGTQLFQALTLSPSNGTGWVVVVSGTARDSISPTVLGITERQTVASTTSAFIGDTGAGLPKWFDQSFTQGGSIRWMTASIELVD